MNAGNDPSEGLKLDFTREDGFTDEEIEEITEWYRETHGDGNLDLVRFVPLVLEYFGPEFKLSKKQYLAVHQAIDGVAIPNQVIVLLYLYTYVLLGYSKGIFYEVINARQQGVSKQLVLDVLRYAYLSSGPRGMNALAERASEYLHSWTSEEGERAIDWPEGWRPDPKAFCSGLDQTSSELTQSDLDAISHWHEKTFGSLPQHVDLFGALFPEAFKLQRIRYERSLGDDCPVQLVPLLILHHAVAVGDPARARYAIRQAQALGVKRHHLVQTLFIGFRERGDPIAMEIVAQSTIDLLLD
jgi:hypothetical protein